MGFREQGVNDERPVPTSYLSTRLAHSLLADNASPCVKICVSPNISSDPAQQPGLAVETSNPPDLQEPTLKPLHWTQIHDEQDIRKLIDVRYSTFNNENN